MRRRPGLFSITRTGILLILVGHLMACAGVIWLMPGGWRWVSAEMFVYRLLPVAVGAVITWSLLLRSEQLQARAIDLLRFLWLAAAMMCLFQASRSFLKLAVLALVVEIVLLIASRLHANRLSRAATILLVVVSVAVVAPVIHTLRSPTPSTRPLGGASVVVADDEPVRRSVQIGELARLDPTLANITFSVGRRFVQVEPLLTFNQRSPDATWTILAPRTARRAPEREYGGVAHRDGVVTARYTDLDGKSVVANNELTISPINAQSFAIAAQTYLRAPIYSHLNTFTQITLAGHKNLRVAFSAVPELRFDVMHAGYPFGAPARFAYLGADRRLHVVQARSGEKGPFTELGSGPLNGPLTITFFDREERIFDFELTDWADQASTELSPAAGWGLPQNAIEFGLMSEDPKSPASVFITLAATGVGRGWSSVGHAEGLYRNRIHIRVPGMGSE